LAHGIIIKVKEMILTFNYTLWIFEPYKYTRMNSFQDDDNKWYV